MGSISLQIPQSGQPNSTEDPKIASDLSLIQSTINGSLDATNLAAAAAQSAGLNQAGQTVKGAVSIATSQSVTSTTYALMPTPDQVTGITLATNGLLRVEYWATWQESVAGAGRAAIFIGANQLRVANGSAQQTEAAATNSATPAVNLVLVTTPIGLVSQGYSGASYTGDVTTGQALGAFGTGVGVVNAEVGGAVIALSGDSAVTIGMGGALEIDNLPAGSYTISVQFKSSSGSVTASNRRLRVQALSFS